MTKPDRRTLEKIEGSSMTKPIARKDARAGGRGAGEKEITGAETTGRDAARREAKGTRSEKGVKTGSSFGKAHKSSMPKAHKSSMEKAHKSSMEKAHKSSMAKAKPSMKKAKSSMEFNKELKAAAKAGKLDNNPKFKAAVMRG